MRKLLIHLCMVSVLLIGPLTKPVFAGGIPTIDAILNAINSMQFLQQIFDYLEQLEILSTEEAQYFVQVQQYIRDLEEYEHTLRQLQGLGQILSDEDWEALLGELQIYYGESDWREILNSNIRTETGRVNIKEVLEKSYPFPKETDDEVSYWRGKISGYEMPENEQAGIARDRAHLQRLLDRNYTIAGNSQEVTLRKKAVKRYMDTANDLGDDSELQTQQLMAQELAHLLAQQEILINRMNQLLMAQETHSEYGAARDYRIRKTAWEQQQKHQNNKLPKSLGTNIWKSF